MAGQRRSRRSFLRQVTATSALLVSHRGLGLAEVTPAAAAIGPPVGVGVIGLGPRGREILSALARLPGASVAAVCDTYVPLHAKALAIAPKAAASAHIRALLDDRAVEAVVVATPTHLHKDVALAALAAGKHVYCEAPLAASIEDARAIAQARLAERFPGYRGWVATDATPLWATVPAS